MKAGGPAWVALALAACTGAPVEEPPEPSPEEAVARAEELADTPGAAPAPAPVPAAAVDGAEAEPPELVFVWHGIGPLYQSFFTHDDVVKPLQADLAGWVRGPANVHIYYDQKTFVGDIRIQILPNTLLRPVAIEGSTVGLSGLAPLTTALARYRDAVSGRFDVRVASFKVAVESVQGPRHCVFGVVGRPPPDGRTVSPCVTLNGQQRCGEAQADGSVRFGAKLVDELRECLNPRD